MKEIVNDTKSAMLKEQFIPDHLFFYVAEGGIRFFDGNKTYHLKKGECGIARKNSLIKYLLSADLKTFEPVLFCLDEPFLRDYLKKHPVKQITKSNTGDAFIRIPSTDLINEFIRSVKPYTKGVMQLDEAFEDLKYEELLLILLRTKPELSDLLFDFAPPEKINLEAFMNRNFTFNVSVSRFAFLTGRSLSAFKRDFSDIFNDTPGRWLMKKRLQEAYFLIKNKNQKPADIYLDLGFESLSHFSVSFKKQFGVNPSELSL